MQVRVRLAPSPTGDPHVGTAYIALFNMAFAKTYGGKLILRIEDTDSKRCHPLYEQQIIEGLHWCNIYWDEGPDVGGKFGPYRQSERLFTYQEICQKLLDKGYAYKCFATPDELAEMRLTAQQAGKPPRYTRRDRNLTPEEIEDRSDQPFVIRLKAPLDGVCRFEDEVRGEISIPWEDVDDQILLKSDGFPTYHLASAVDDHLMKISHVIRGDEWISSVPKQVLIYSALEWQMPKYIHMPLLLDKDGRKLSKRRSPTALLYYRDSGYLAEALLNFLSLMGYSIGSGKEFYPVEELINTFQMERIGKSGAVFDIHKLDWLNQQHIIRQIPEQDLWYRLRSWGFAPERMAALMSLCHTRMRTFGDFADLSYPLFAHTLKYREEIFAGVSKQQGAILCQALLFSLEGPRWNHELFGAATRKTANIAQINHKRVLMPVLFAALTGKRQGLPLFRFAELLGPFRTKVRLQETIAFLGGMSQFLYEAIQEGWQKENLLEFFPR